MRKSAHRREKLRAFGKLSEDYKSIAPLLVSTYRCYCCHRERSPTQTDHENTLRKGTIVEHTSALLLANCHSTGLLDGLSEF